MKTIDSRSFYFRVSLTVFLILNSTSFFGQTWECQILPSERQVVTDKASGAMITFVTTNKSDDRNLYFHDRCWLLDQEVMLFNSDRTGRNEIYGYMLNDQFYIAVVEIATGKTNLIASPDFPIQHIQFSWTQPDLLSFARSYGKDTAPLDPFEPPHARIWFVSVNTRTPVPAFYQKPGELVTHESWWVNDQMLFIGGHRVEEAHVKVMNSETGDIRIVGAGAWMEGIEARELSKVNWWHASGSRDGR